MVILVVGSGDRCGKSTAARIVAREIGASRTYETSEYLIRAIEALGGTVPPRDDEAAYRRVMRAAGDRLNELLPGVLVRMAAHEWRSDDSAVGDFVCAGLRRDRELRAILRDGLPGCERDEYVVIWIDRRGHDEGGELQPPNTAEPDHWSMIADRVYYVANDGDLYDLECRLADIARRLREARS